MEAVKRVPIMALPCAIAFVQGQVEKRQDRFVDFFLIDLHGVVRLMQRVLSDSAA